jgi:RNA polymerase sigma-70 factor (ECF subfamily)
MQDNDREHTEAGSTRELAILVRSAIDGDRRSFEELIRMYQGSIFSMVYARTQSRSDSEDLVQEVFLKAYRNIHTLKDAGVFRAWLYRIAINSVNDFHRKRKFTSLFGLLDQDTENDLPSPDQDGFDHLASKQFWGNFNTFLARLPRQQQEVFRLRFLDHLNIQEISRVLGRSESAVKTHLYRALDRFRAEGPSLGLCSEEAV